MVRSLPYNEDNNPVFSSTEDRTHEGKSEKTVNGRFLRSTVQYSVGTPHVHTTSWRRESTPISRWSPNWRWNTLWSSVPVHRLIRRVQGLGAFGTLLQTTKFDDPKPIKQWVEIYWYYYVSNRWLVDFVSIECFRKRTPTPGPSTQFLFYKKSHRKSSSHGRGRFTWLEKDHFPVNTSSSGNRGWLEHFLSQRRQSKMG